MGRTPIPLVIGVLKAHQNDPEIQELREMGHEIVVIPDVSVVLDPLTLSRASYIEAALKGARARKKAASEPKAAKVKGRKGSKRSEGKGDVPDEHSVPV